MTIAASKKKACVIGWPIKHSRSPLIHSAWLDHFGIDGSYEKIAIEPARLRAFFERMTDDGYVGCNVTSPHKEAVFGLADERDASAVAAGAANTVWLTAGRICVANTDTHGFMANLASAVPDWYQRRGPVCILGAGGAARSIVHGFLEAGVTEVRLTNRRVDRAERMAAELDPIGGRVRALPWDELVQATRDAAVIVNATSLGLDGQGCPPIDFTRCENNAVVADIVYVPLETEFLRRARLAGLATVDGLGMLLHQAVPGFEKWFGVRPQVTPALRALVAADIAGT